MGARSFIVRGKERKVSESLGACSARGGPGDEPGRSQAAVQGADQVRATEGVECRKDADVIDETPMVYKDIDAVMAAQADLVEVVHTLRQVVRVQG